MMPRTRETIESHEERIRQMQRSFKHIDAQIEIITKNQIEQEAYLAAICAKLKISKRSIHARIREIRKNFKNEVVLI